MLPRGAGNAPSQTRSGFEQPDLVESAWGKMIGANDL